MLKRLLRRLGLYAEQLGDELSYYEDDPLGRIDYLQSMNFRAARLVVVTGLHHKRWTMAQAMRWFMDTTGFTAGRARSELNRYCAWARLGARLQDRPQRNQPAARPRESDDGRALRFQGLQRSGRAD